MVDLALHHRAVRRAVRARACALEQQARARCGSARAGCAARAPASRGTRPCAGRPRAAPLEQLALAESRYWRSRARSAVRTALTSAATRTGRSSSVTLPSRPITPRDRPRESAPWPRQHEDRQVRPRRLRGRASRSRSRELGLGERLLGDQQRAGAARHLGAQLAPCRRSRAHSMPRSAQHVAASAPRPCRSARGRRTRVVSALTPRRQSRIGGARRRSDVGTPVSTPRKSRSGSPSSMPLAVS